jgi:hypothetical protein
MLIKPSRTRSTAIVGGLLLAAVAVGHAVGVKAARQDPQDRSRAWAEGVLRGSVPVVLSGNDIGFRWDSRDARRPTGQLVVRINGTWVEATTTAVYALHPAK